MRRFGDLVPSLRMPRFPMILTGIRVVTMASAHRIPKEAEASSSKRQKSGPRW